MTLITLENIGKAYRSFRPEWRRFARWFGIALSPSTENWVLRNVSFSIASGEAVGIIGQNGAGKSTLLKVITGTVQPSEGSIIVNGRISAILELGLGFNGELTGRQNAYHAAGLMGVSNEEILRVIPEIESFAEIGAYFDKPVRTYSSGMQARLAFSVATAFRPDLLIVDEVLAVGDSYFMHKCTNRILDFKNSGTSLLVVAHDRAAVQSLCDRAVLLDKGEMLMEGDPETVLDYYNALIAEKESSTIQQKKRVDGRTQTSSGSLEAQVSRIELLDLEGSVVDLINVGDEVVLSVEICINAAIPDLVFGYLIKDRLGNEVFGTNTFHCGIPMDNLKLGQRLHLGCQFTANLGAGSYSITIALHTGESHIAKNYEWRELALVFDVKNISHDAFTGMNWMPPKITLSA